MKRLKILIVSFIFFNIACISTASLGDKSPTSSPDITAEPSPKSNESNEQADLPDETAEVDGQTDSYKVIGYVDLENLEDYPLSSAIKQLIKDREAMGFDLANDMSVNAVEMEYLGEIDPPNQGPTIERLYLLDNYLFSFQGYAWEVTDQSLSEMVTFDYTDDFPFREKYIYHVYMNFLVVDEEKKLAYGSNYSPLYDGDNEPVFDKTLIIDYSNILDGDLQYQEVDTSKLYNSTEGSFGQCVFSNQRIWCTRSETKDWDAGIYKNLIYRIDPTTWSIMKYEVAGSTIDPKAFGQIGHTGLEIENENLIIYGGTPSSEQSYLYVFNLTDFPETNSGESETTLVAPSIMYEGDFDTSTGTLYQTLQAGGFDPIYTYCLDDLPYYLDPKAASNSIACDRFEDDSMIVIETDKIKHDGVISDIAYIYLSRPKLGSELSFGDWEYFVMKGELKFGDWEYSGYPEDGIYDRYYVIEEYLKLPDDVADEVSEYSNIVVYPEQKIIIVEDSSFYIFRYSQ